MKVDPAAVRRASQPLLSVSPPRHMLKPQGDGLREGRGRGGGPQGGVSALAKGPQIGPSPLPLREDTARESLCGPALRTPKLRCVHPGRPAPELWAAHVCCSQAPPAPSVEARYGTKAAETAPSRPPHLPASPRLPAAWRTISGLAPSMKPLLTPPPLTPFSRRLTPTPSPRATAGTLSR